jgi:AcrR family transcriptional regulator
MCAVVQQQARPRKRLTARARREQLLDATLAIVSDQGFQGVSVRSVAQKAGVSRPIVYEHFGDLHGLLEALVKRETLNALEQISATALGDLSEGDPAELMLESLSRYLDAVERHPATWRLVLMPPEGAPELLRKSIIRGRGDVLESLTQAVRPGSMPGNESPDPEMTARIISTIADEYARLVLTDPERFPPERLLLHAGWLVSHLLP